MSAQNPQAKVTILDLHEKKTRGEKIVMLTAYDYTSALLVDQAGVEVILVGDSLGMVMLGYDSTVAVTMTEMLHHCRAVARGARRAFKIGDMPFGSYEASPAEAVRNAARFLKDGLMEAVKLEGGLEMAPAVKAIVAAGIPVMGHIGLTPQSLSKFGGYRVQGKTAESAFELLQDALILQDAGCFAIVLEAIPAPLAALITARLEIPAIGIGAGADCDGQVLVYHDLLGLFEGLQPRFVKRYAQAGNLIRAALLRYREEVSNRSFPGAEHTYQMPPAEMARLEEMINNAEAQ